MLRKLLAIALGLAGVLILLALYRMLQPPEVQRSPPAVPKGGLTAIDIPPPLCPQVEEFRGQVKPGSDRFALEAEALEIAGRLPALSALFRDPSGEGGEVGKLPSGLEEVLSADIRCAPFRPSREKAIHRAAGIEAFEGAYDASPPPDWLRGAAASGAEIAEFIRPLPSLETASFQILGIERREDGSFSTDLRYQLSGKAGDGARRVWSGLWKAAWNRERKITEIRPAEAIRAVLGELPFEDVAAQALGGSPSFSSQLLPGLDFFRDRIDGAAGIGVEGFHGIAVGDADGDGLEDFYLPEPPGLPNLLFRNLGNGSFEDISRGSGADLLDGTSQALFLDLDGDGDQDLFLVLRDRILVLKNTGGGRFEKYPSGIEGLPVKKGALTCAAAADYDLDGSVDVFVGASVFFRGGASPLCTRAPLPLHDPRNGAPSFLLKNLGDGRFQDVTREAGLAGLGRSFTISAAWGDLDDDGHPDLCIASQYGSRRLFRNQGDGTFADVTSRAGLEGPAMGSSVTWEDFDGDGRLDLYLGGLFSSAGLRIAGSKDFKEGSPLREAYRSLSRGSALFRNSGNGTFEDRSLRARARGSGWAWASDSIDFDLDGREDIYNANGFVTGSSPGDLASFFFRQVLSQSPDSALQRSRYAGAWEALQRMVREDGSWGGGERNSLLLGCDDGGFADISPASGIDLGGDGRSFAVLDYDIDGRPDIILRSRRGPRLRILRNRLSCPGHSVWFSLFGETGNRDAIGARIEIETGRGRRAKMVKAGTGFLSQGSRWIVFGLGDEGSAGKVRIRWPGGNVQELAGIEAGFRYRIFEGKAPEKEGLGDGSHASAGKNGNPTRPSAGPLEPPQDSPLAKVWLLDPFPAPDLEIPDLRGAKRSLREFRGKPLILLFLSPACGASIREAEELRAGLPEIRRSGGEVLALAVAKAGHREEVQDRFEGALFPVLPLSDEALRVWNEVHRWLLGRPRDIGTPTTFLIDSGGRIEKVVRGFTPWAELSGDLGLLPLSPEKRLSLALPFGGTHLGPPFRRDPLLLGAALNEAGATGEAIRIFNGLLAEEPENLEALLHLGIAQERDGKGSDSEKTYGMALSLAPDFGPALRSLGLLRQGGGDLVGARKLLLHALEAGDGESARLLAAAYLREERPAEASKLCREALRSDPESTALWITLGLSLAREGESVEGIAAFERALEISPADPEASDGLSSLLQERGTNTDLERARSILEAAALRNPGDLRLLNSLGRIRTIFEDFEGAEKAFREAIASHPEDESAYLNLARLKLNAKDHRGAESILRDLLTVNPSSRRGRELLSDITK